MILLEACFLESVRLFPPVAGDNKECIKDCTFPCGQSLIILLDFCIHIFNSYIYINMIHLQYTDLFFYVWVAVYALFILCISIYYLGSRIPAGSVIAYSPYCLNRLHEYWKDAEDFIPNRWIQHDDENNTDKIIQPSAFVYPSFNAGFRLCLGKPMVRGEDSSLIYNRSMTTL